MRLMIRTGANCEDSKPPARNHIVKATSHKVTSSAKGAPPHEGGTGPQIRSRDRLRKRTSGEGDGVRPADQRNEKEHLEDMVRQIMKESADRKDDEREWEFAPSKTPLTERIKFTKFPRKFNSPTIQAYNRTGDPNLFLYKYDQHMDGARATDELKCLYFPVYLEGVA